MDAATRVKSNTPSTGGAGAPGTCAIFLFIDVQMLTLDVNEPMHCTNCTIT